MTPRVVRLNIGPLIRARRLEASGDTADQPYCITQNRADVPREEGSAFAKRHFAGGLADR